MKVSIKTLGCKVNSYESEFVRSLFLKKGYSIVEDSADIYVVNTCSVTNEADKKSRKLINSIRNKNKNSIIAIMGCFCEHKKEEIKSLVDVDIIIGNKDKSKIVDYIEEFIESKNKKELFYDISKEDFENMEIDKFETKTRAFVKVEDGCNNFCSYCIIPYVRGRVRSKPKDKVLSEIKHLGKNGHKEVVLTGIHTGQYDDAGYRLSDLIKDISKIKEIIRIRLSSIEVVEINDEIIEEFKNNTKFVSHLHIPLQSGCNKTLKNMNRRYDSKYFKEKTELLRTIRTDLSVSTDVIVGFPGETEEDFTECYEFCKEIKFSKIHVFPYSDRDGTVASKMNNKVDDRIKKERTRKLIDLSNSLEEEYNNSFIGKELDILFEEEKDGYYIGHASNYVKIRVRGNYKLNEIYNIKIKKDMLLGEKL